MLSRNPWGGLADPDATGPSTALSPPAVEDTPPFDVGLLGLPYDGSVSFREGAAEAPARLREISDSSPAISEEGFVIEAARLRLRDLGDVVPDALRVKGGATAEAARQEYFAQVHGAAGEAHDAGAFLLGLGGDHAVTIPLVRSFAASRKGSFGLVSLDAHPDLFDVYDDSCLSHACPLRRALELDNLAPEHLLILGTRSYNAVELDFMRAHDIDFVPARQIDGGGVAKTLDRVRERLAGLESVYLTLDIDVADPACAPGTGAPVAGGLSSRQTLELVRGLVEDLPVASMDLVEIAPPLDPTQATLFLGLQIIFETLAALAQRER